MSIFSSIFGKKPQVTVGSGKDRIKSMYSGNNGKPIFKYTDFKTDFEALDNKGGEFGGNGNGYIDKSEVVRLGQKYGFNADLIYNDLIGKGSGEALANFLNGLQRNYYIKDGEVIGEGNSKYDSAEYAAAKYNGDNRKDLIKRFNDDLTAAKQNVSTSLMVYDPTTKTWKNQFQWEGQYYDYKSIDEDTKKRLQRKWIDDNIEKLSYNPNGSQVTWTNEYGNSIEVLDAQWYKDNSDLLKYLLLKAYRDNVNNYYNKSKDKGDFSDWSLDNLANIFGIEKLVEAYNNGANPIDSKNEIKKLIQEYFKSKSKDDTGKWNYNRAQSADAIIKYIKEQLDNNESGEYNYLRGFNFNPDSRYKEDLLWQGSSTSTSTNNSYNMLVTSAKKGGFLKKLRNSLSTQNSTIKFSQQSNSIFSNYITGHKKEGTLNMNTIKYFQNGGPVAPQQAASAQGEQDIQQKIIQLVQAAMQGDQQATQAINQIMEAAKQGDQQAIQLAQMIQEVAQQMQGQAQSAKRGAKFAYLKSLKSGCPEGTTAKYYRKGGELCKECVQAQKFLRGGIGSTRDPEGAAAEEKAKEDAEAKTKATKTPVRSTKKATTPVNTRPIVKAVYGEPYYETQNPDARIIEMNGIFGDGNEMNQYGRFVTPTYKYIPIGNEQGVGSLLIGMYPNEDGTVATDTLLVNHPARQWNTGSPEVQSAGTGVWGPGRRISYTPGEVLVVNDPTATVSKAFEEAQGPVRVVPRVTTNKKGGSLGKNKKLGKIESNKCGKKMKKCEAGSELKKN